MTGACDISGWLGYLPDWQHPGLYFCLVFIGRQPVRVGLSFRAVHDDFGNLVEVRP